MASQPLSWINEDPETLQKQNRSESPPSYRPRRTHAKSRNGCQNCKQRRIKCDEARPCNQCRDRKVQCDFVRAPIELPQNQECLGQVPISVDDRVASQSLAREQFEIYLDKQDLSYPCSNLELLDHFIEAPIPCIGSTACQRILQQHGIQLSVGAPYLLHAILAFSASHLSFLQPSEIKYGVAASLHYDRSLAAFSSQISTCLDANNADAILGCCHIHTMLAFANMQPAESAEKGGAPTWLRTMQGVGILRSSLRPCLDRTVWTPVHIESRSWVEVSCDHTELDETWASNTSKALHQLCEVDFKLTQPGNPYWQPLSRLCMILQCDTGHDKIGIFISFIGKLLPSFIELLDQNDPRAMLILCYWSALLSQIDQWWIVRSAKSECLRLCKYLDTIPDQRIRDMLRFPASKCGYLMSQPV